MKHSIVLISIFRESLIGGVAVHSSNLYERLREAGLPVERIDFAFIFQRPTVLSRAWIMFKIGFRLLRLRLAGARVFHFHASNRALVFYLFAPLLKLLGGKVLLSLHSGYGYDRWLEEHPSYDRLNTLFFRWLDRLVFMNPEECARIRRRYPWLGARVVTVNPYLAPPAKRLPPLPPSAADRSRMRVATIGVWEQRYNVEEAVRAALNFHAATGVATTLTILQSTIRCEPDYQRRVLAEISAAREHIEVLVLEDRTDVLEVLAAQDVFIRPSLLDSYGLCVAESLLVGTPAIATDVCRRCSAALLYRKGDDAALLQHLLDVWQRGPGPRHSLLADAEDSFNAYLREYRQLAGEADATLASDVSIT
ncbi:glycosyltransferase [Neolewinella lacunae]|uniref:Glycosyltransferase family 4 protein n=1 Tax=Neolewinella lacunae TaxID=1517758 RepID=A0A923PMW2_9BACT|nr:glycosyltransferase [Neolewinella lacunae]MBC6994143.1 glycosyltransferase family 4 protein [Neolewinella lacunae]MDN3636708.1 glycosyltransferase [Neolewinella lacunae]